LEKGWASALEEARIGGITDPGPSGGRQAWR
jgi:hypothetical protein